ncbi:uncharacterized protein LOC103513134 [Diaphorina citri]|uniref:Uncharacterized protein LOC103513134 n=1 Tax=Diaphorina citri TaxID=121845 RepID=A0A1S3D946_DIACI|nr:uncharacterized protein LOC103513134 [Diaphorina citri]
MAGVHNTRSRLFDKEPGGYQPYQHVQSMGDDFIEDLAYKQNDKHYSLQKLLNEEKEFQSSHTFKPITEYNEGTTSLQSFISHVDSNEPQACTSNESPERYLGLSRHEYDILKSGSIKDFDEGGWVEGEKYGPAQYCPNFLKQW